MTALLYSAIYSRKREPAPKLPRRLDLNQQETGRLPAARHQRSKPAGLPFISIGLLGARGQDASGPTGSWREYKKPSADRDSEVWAPELARSRSSSKAPGFEVSPRGVKLES